MKHAIIIGFLIATLLAACRVAPTPAPAIDGVQTRVAGTLTALAALIPTDTATPLPTGTSAPTETVVTSTRTATSTQPPKPTKTPKPKLFIGCFTPNGIKGATAPFKLEAHTNKRVVAYINGVSRNGDHPIYCTEIVKQGLPITLTLMWGDYTYMVQIGNKITRYGSFFINDDDKATMRIFEDKIAIGPFQ